MKTAAIIPAAGLGTRMRSPHPKQFLTLEGVPIIVHTLRKFAQCKKVDTIFVAIRESDKPRLEELLAQEGLDSLVRLVGGGTYRQDSVYNGFSAADSDTDVVVVHDAVRPFVDVELISAVIEEAYLHGGAILAVPCVDTVKQVEKNRVTATLPREKIVLVQTPQAFRYAILKEAFEKARADNFFGTDEASLVERLGHDVMVVRGSERNLKITKPSDIPLAELLFQLDKNLQR
jgi:2-C-methyl-D-erythritol 4-phosphate cytidylyltransferase